MVHCALAIVIIDLGKIIDDNKRIIRSATSHALVLFRHVFVDRAAISDSRSFWTCPDPGAAATTSHHSYKGLPSPYSTGSVRHLVDKDRKCNICDTFYRQENHLVQQHIRVECRDIRFGIDETNAFNVDEEE